MLCIMLATSPQSIIYSIPTNISNSMIEAVRSLHIMIDFASNSLLYSLIGRPRILVYVDSHGCSLLTRV